MYNARLRPIDHYLRVQLNSLIKNDLDNVVLRRETCKILHIIDGNFQTKRSWKITSIGYSFIDVFFREEDIGAYVDFSFKNNSLAIIQAHWNQKTSDGNMYADRENLLDEVVVYATKKERTPGVVIQNEYKRKLNKIRYFIDGSLKPSFGIYAYKKGSMQVEGKIIEQELTETVY